MIILIENFKFGICCFFFKSQQKELPEDKSHDDAIFGMLSNNKLEDKINTDSLSEKIPSHVDIDTYAHPSVSIYKFSQVLGICNRMQKWEALMA